MKFEHLILGGGPAGYACALAMAKAGMETALIEEGPLGGTCLNVGCIPTKALLESGHMFEKAGGMNDFGVRLRESPAFDFAMAMKRKDLIVAELRGQLRKLFDALGIGIIPGRGRILEKGIMELRTEAGGADLIHYGKLVIATGSRPKPFPSAPFDGRAVLSSDQILSLTEAPATLLVIGAGVIGIELASFFATIGVATTVTDILPEILPSEPAPLARRLRPLLKKRGIEFLLGRKILSLEACPEGVRACFEGDAEALPRSFSTALVAIGRSRNSGAIGLENTSARLDGDRIMVDASLMADENIYAIGDVSSRVMLAHYASHQGIHLARQLLGVPGIAPYSEPAVPSVVYSLPPIASVRVKDFETLSRENRLISGKFHYGALGRALAMNLSEGYFEAFIDRRNFKPAGFFMLGEFAPEHIGLGAMLLDAEIDGPRAVSACFPHPTVSEGLIFSLEEALSYSIYSHPARSKGKVVDRG